MSRETCNLRKELLTISNKGHDGNLQSSFSSMEILWTLYDKILNISPQNIEDEDRDIFVLSKGQSTEALLEILATKGFFDKEELDSFCKIDSRMAMQADRTKIPGIEISAGSLGHGLPQAVGMAWAKKIRNKSGRVFCLVGDGEMNEGTMWEALIFAYSEKLDNLTVIVDDNDSIGRLIDLGSLEEKFKAFGFEVEIINGHNEEELEKSLKKMKQDKPRAIIAKTIRGYGCKTLMEDRSWFHRYPKNEELPRLLEEVDDFFGRK